VHASRDMLMLYLVFCRIVGFEELNTVEGKEDDFKTGALELRLKHSGTLPPCPFLHFLFRLLVFHPFYLTLVRPDVS
jgi:hypothetical protein